MLRHSLQKYLGKAWPRIYAETLCYTMTLLAKTIINTLCYLIKRIAIKKKSNQKRQKFWEKRIWSTINILTTTYTAKISLINFFSQKIILFQKVTKLLWQKCIIHVDFTKLNNTKVPESNVRVAAASDFSFPKPEESIIKNISKGQWILKPDSTWQYETIEVYYLLS